MCKFLPKMEKKKGASTLEYIVMVTAVVSLLVVFLRPSGPFSNSLASSYSTVSNGMLGMGVRLSSGISPIVASPPFNEPGPTNLGPSGNLDFPPFFIP